MALGGIVFSFVYWSFGFLRMGTTGFTAQASGAGESAEARAAIARALLMGVCIGVCLWLVRAPIIALALGLLNATPEVEAMTQAYFDLRIWGAPATLGTFAILGGFVGLGKTRHLLVTQLVLNGLNIALDLLFAGVLGWGVPGIAIGTAIAEWVTLFVALALLVHVLREGHQDGEPFLPWDRILDRSRARETIGANADIMVRTLFLLLGFAWFTDQGARFGDDLLAANHVLLQLVTLSAYLLDGYAHATEILVGRAVGRGALRSFDQTVRTSFELAAVSAIGLGLFALLGGGWAIHLLTDLEAVRSAARLFLPYAVVYISLSFAAFQLDGIFIGATGTRAMRNASAASCLFFLALSSALSPRWGNHGLWVAFIVYVVARALTLGAYFPALRRGLVSTASPGRSP